jgi:hypothetical protein
VYVYFVFHVCVGVCVWVYLCMLFASRSFCSFAEYRWIVLALPNADEEMDEHKVVGVRLYTNSQPEEFADLNIGDTILLSNVQLLQVPTNADPPHCLSAWFSSSWHSQLNLLPPENSALTEEVACRRYRMPRQCYY